MKKKEKRRTKETIKLFNHQEVNKEISLLAENLIYTYQYLKPGVPDCFIAATAKYLDAELFTSQ